MDTAEDFTRKWSGCFVHLKEQQFVALLNGANGKHIDVSTQALGRIRIPYTEQGLKRLNLLVPEPGYYQLGANAWYLMRTGARQFRRGLGPKNYVLFSPINANFGGQSEGTLLSPMWDIGNLAIDFAEADAILHQTIRGMPKPADSVKTLLNKNNKVFVSLALTRMFAACLSPAHTGLFLFLWNKYVANLVEDSKTVVCRNPMFEQEVSDFVRDHLREYRFVPYS